MSTITTEFDTYRISVHSQNEIWLKSYKRKSHIALYRGSVPVGSLNFVPEGSPAKDTIYYSSTQREFFTTLTYYEHDFARIVDILRNEKPLFLEIRTDQTTSTRTTSAVYGVGTLKTSAEPVGEEESS